MFLVPFHSSYMKSVLGAEAGGDVDPLTQLQCAAGGAQSWWGDVDPLTVQCATGRVQS